MRLGNSRVDICSAFYQTDQIRKIDTHTTSQGEMQTGRVCENIVTNQS